MGVVDVALHIEHGYPAGLGDVTDVSVADPPVDVADGDPVVVAPEDLADLLGRVAVRDLGRAALDELGVAAELGHARLEGGPRPGAGEEEQHGEDLVTKVGMRKPEGAVPLQGEGHVEQGVQLVLGPLLKVDDVFSPQVGLHLASYSTAPSTSDSRAMRMTTPLKASNQ